MITTTLNKLRAFSPCQESWQKFLRFKNKRQADDEEFPIVEILDSNGLSDCIWALRVCPLYAMLFARVCSMRANEYAITHAANAANAVYAANATHAAAYAAYAANAANVANAANAADHAAHAAAYAANVVANVVAYAIEREWQAEFLRKIL